MSKQYDNWERLVVAVLQRQHDRELAMCSSTDSSPFSSGRSSSFTCEFYDHLHDAINNSNAGIFPFSGHRSTSSYSHLPSDLPEIVSRSVSPVVYASNKELFFSLCRSPILIDAGKLSFSLEKESGKKCYMVGARELGIIWCGDTPWYWDLTPHPDSRFSEVALLKTVFWLEIRGTINTQMLSPNTVYAAYLVYKLDRNPYGLESANAFVRFTKDEVGGRDERKAILDHFVQESARDRHARTGDVPVRMGDGLTEIAVVHLHCPQKQQQSGRVGVGRRDGWMELELGSFFNNRGEDGVVETWLLGKEGYQVKSGLIVQGIEFRPKSQIDNPGKEGYQVKSGLIVQGIEFRPKSQIDNQRINGKRSGKTIMGKMIPFNLKLQSRDL